MIHYQYQRYSPETASSGETLHKTHADASAPSFDDYYDKCLVEQRRSLSYLQTVKILTGL